MPFEALNIELPEDNAVGIFGKPGMGKTVFAERVHEAQTGYSIFINTMWRARQGKEASTGPFVRRLDDEAAKLFSARGKLVLNTDEPEVVTDAIVYLEQVFETGEYGKCRVFVDECDTFARCYQNDPKKNAIVRLFSKDRNRHLLGACIAQNRSGMVSATIKKNCGAYFIFRLDSGEWDDACHDYGLRLELPKYWCYHYDAGGLALIDPAGNRKVVKAIPTVPTDPDDIHEQDLTEEENHDRDNPQPGESNPPAEEMGPPDEKDDKT